MSEIPTEVSLMLQSVCQAHNFADYQIKIHKGNDKGEGYLGEIVFLTVSDQTQKLDLVIKRAFTSETIRSVHPIRDAFINEIYFYDEVLPKLIKFQQDKNVKRIFDSYAKCLKVSSKMSEEYLILENIKMQGYNVIDRTGLLNEQQTELILKEYGKFHAISFAYKEQYPEKFEEIAAGTLNLFDKFNQISFFRKALQQVSELAMEALVPGRDDLVIKKFGKYLTEADEIFERTGRYRATEKNAVLLHGDCWSNNIMFKIDGSGNTTGIKLIDWQLTRPGTPVYDLSYCLYSGATKPILDNLDHYLKIYHNSLSDYLSELGGNSSLFTFEDLKDDWKQYSQFGFVMSMLLCKSKLHRAEDAIDLTDFTGEDEEFGNSFIACSYDKEIFNERVRNMIVSMDENGVL